MLTSGFAATLLEVLARASGPLIKWVLQRGACALKPDVPRLAGHWIARFRDPQGSRSVPVAIEATLTQRGRRISGVAHLMGQPHDVFTFDGTVKRNVFYGSYARLDSHVLAGTGTFVLKVAATSKKLSGHCIWYDAILDDVWVSPYSWERVG